MNSDQLTGRYWRLQHELSVAYGSVPWNTGHIDRLIDELSATEREMAGANSGIPAPLTPSAYTDSSA